MLTLQARITNFKFPKYLFINKCINFGKRNLHCTTIQCEKIFIHNDFKITFSQFTIIQHSLNTTIPPKKIIIQYSSHQLEERRKFKQY